MNEMKVIGLNVAFPGSTMRVASVPYSSASGGQYLPRVMSWGSLNYKRSDRGGSLTAVETEVTVDDTDRTIARIYSGASADSVRGSVATIYEMEEGVASSSWRILFYGIVVRVSFPSPFVTKLTLRTNDDQLQRKSPNGHWVITPQNWPNADPKVYGQSARILYGTHDSSKFRTGPGLVPTIKLDGVAFRYLICAARAKSITRVFVDGVLSTPTTDWSTEYVTRGGRLYTCVTFTSDQGDGVVTADVVGYDTNADSTGTVISDPVSQWAHWLSNFVLGDYTGIGGWFAHNALISTSELAVASALLSALPATGSPHASTPLTGIEITANLCKTYKFRAWWTMAGKIAIGKDNPHVTDVYGGTNWKYYRDELGPFAFRDDDFQRKSRLVVRSAPSAADNSYLQSLEVVDASATTVLQDFLDMPWSASS